MNATVAEVAPARSSFNSLPVGLFGAVMCLTGLSARGEWRALSA
jgi:hypothetical protein